VQHVGCFPHIEPPPPCDHFAHEKNWAAAKLKQSHLSSLVMSRRTALAPWCCTAHHLGRRSTRAPPRQRYPQAKAPPRCTPSPPFAADQGEHNRDLLIIAKPLGQYSSKTMDHSAGGGFSSELRWRHHQASCSAPSPPHDLFSTIHLVASDPD
jgi:hypothetical protein